MRASAFLLRFKPGPATINQIGIVAGIPRTKVYGAVRKLVERGLLVQSEEDEKIFSAKSPSEVLIPLLEKERRRINQGLEALAELELIHQSMRYVKRSGTLLSKIVRYSPRIVVTRKIQELFQDSKTKIVILTSANGLIRLSKLAGVLYDRSKLGMKLEVYSAERDEPIFHTAIQSIKEIENASVTLIPSAISDPIIVVDRQHVLVSDLRPDDMRDDGMDVAFLIQNSEMAEIIESLVRLSGAKLSTSLSCAFLRLQLFLPILL